MKQMRHFMFNLSASTKKTRFFTGYFLVAKRLKKMVSLRWL